MDGCKTRPAGLFAAIAVIATLVAGLRLGPPGEKCGAVARAAESSLSAASQGARSGKNKQPKPPRLDKRTGQGQLRAVIDGQPERAVQLCQRVLQFVPEDRESLFVLTVAQAQLGRLDEAVATMHRAIKAGVPPERFLAGPRELLEPLSQTEAFAELAEKYAGRLIHGPMLGAVTDRSARFWVRTAEEVPVQVIAGERPQLREGAAGGVIKSPTVFTDRRRDYTAVAEIVGLKPDTRYYYDVLVKGRSQLGPEYPSFRTFPPAGEPARFKVGFGGGAGYTEQHERMWLTILRHRPLAFLLLGDNVYIDDPTRPAMQRYTYYRRQSRPEYRRLVASTAIYAIWDDHDFGTNDCWYGPAIDEPAWKRPVWRVFCNNWNNPSYGGGKDQLGCWFTFSIGDVDFFMLDCRFYRSDPKLEHASMLGAAQKKWLFDQLRRSQGTFKVLASSVPWVLDAKGTSRDTWRGFQEERAEIFAFLEKNRIDGVLLLSADRHRSDVWRIDRPGAYPLWEFESSRLTNIHRHSPMPGALFSYNEKCSFGLLSFDTTTADPTVTYQIINIDDELIHTHTVRLSEISHR